MKKTLDKENRNLVFVVEDNDWYCKMIAHIVSMNPDFEVMTFTNGKECIDNLNLQPFAICLDYSLPDVTGLEVLKKTKAYNPEIEVIIISEQEDIETAINLLKFGAYDYLVKAKDIKNKIFNSLANIFKKHQLVLEVDNLRSQVQTKYSFSKLLIGESDKMKEVYQLMERTLNNDITVSITGETGTGKEMVAKAIHYNSKRKTKPFIPVNVTAVPRELIESEFFGYERGAFTGAMSRRVGKFEEADGGTLFLDEIGDMDAAFQAKLLRVLQEQEIVRLGNNKPVKIDVRIIVATHKDLLEEVRKGNFREDLFYRLIGLTIFLPPLRERDQDVLMLAQHFINSFCKSNGYAPKTISKEAKHKFLSYDFPGNVRELKTVAELSVVMSNSDDIRPEDLTFQTSNKFVGNNHDKDMTMRQYELKIVKSHIRKYEGNIKLAAQKLKIGTATIYRMLKAEEEILAETPGIDN